VHFDGKSCSCAMKSMATQPLCNSLVKSILTRAFRGKLVPQDPSDEPASVLLDGIRAEREKVGGT